MRVTLLLVSLLIAGCATYAARPVDTADSAARYHARRLEDPAVGAALDSLGVATPLGVWHDWELAQAAWVLRPERARLAAEIRVADAARITAGARPIPGLTTETEYSFSGTAGESRWGAALSTLFTIELGGKRGARLGRANAAVLAVVARAQEEAWDVRWRVRDALAQREQDARVLEAGVGELGLIDTVLTLMRARFEEGSISGTELARMEADRQDAAIGVAALKRALDSSRTTLATRVGLPLAELDRLTLVFETGPACADSAATDSVERVALTTRRELRRALAEYQVAEGDLRVEVAKSWPDLQLGPGLFFDHGVGKWTIALGLPSVPLNRNRGPIAEAEARREVAARRFAEVQEQVLGEVTMALAACRSAGEEMASLDLRSTRKRVELAEAAYRRGEIGRLELEFVRLELERATRRLIEAGGRLTAAGLSLEHAVGIWTGAPSAPLERGGLQ